MKRSTQFKSVFVDPLRRLITFLGLSFAVITNQTFAAALLPETAASIDQSRQLERYLVQYLNIKSRLGNPLESQQDLRREILILVNNNAGDIVAWQQANAKDFDSKYQDVGTNFSDRNEASLARACKAEIKARNEQESVSGAFLQAEFEAKGESVPSVQIIDIAISALQKEKKAMNDHAYGIGILMRSQQFASPANATNTPEKGPKASGNNFLAAVVRLIKNTTTVIVAAIASLAAIITAIIAAIIEIFKRRKRSRLHGSK